MKKLTVLTILIFSSLNADAKDCEAFNALKPFAGRFQYGNCKIELHLCETDQKRPQLPFYLKKKETDNYKFWMGDILITDAAGNSVYMPLYSPNANFANTQVRVEDNRKDFIYSYSDKNMDPVSGLKESYQLKISKRREEIEISKKNSNESRKNPIRSLFYPNIKINCNK